MDEAGLRHWLRLVRTENVGPVTFRQLLARYGVAEAALEALPELAARGGLKRKLIAPSLQQIDDELADLTKRQAQVITLRDAAYPSALKTLPDAPPVLVVKGHVALLSKPSVAFVGARHASMNGRRFAEKLARDVGQAGYIVVSGLAAGIDASAHYGALATGTVGVIAGGLESVYPPENADLYAKMADLGAIVTEMPVGTPIKPTLFPRRNRIVAGLALGVVVVEAAPQSGSLITARLAGEYGREVMAVPGSPLDPRASGTNKLLKQGATLIECAADILEAVRVQGAESPSPADYEAPASTPLSEANLDKARARVWQALSPSGTPMDALVRDCALPPATILAVLLELELAGRLVRGAGGQVARLVDLSNSIDSPLAERA